VNTPVRQHDQHVSHLAHSALHKELHRLKTNHP
jgi:hypothetical protein